MSDFKRNEYSSQLAREYADNLSSGNASAVAEAPVRPRRESAAERKGREVTSWDAYRNWLTKVQAPEQHRSLPDPALFSFRGYRSWAEKIRRDWEHDE
ncbi:MAG: hypothetical protein GY727_06930 [Gammaproteobacteria bacterium]|nr:hypothetical protein [Gammaproteobacteria bacterium]MCP4091604.1 hypothetical protein [Gammaproteobacteria bacterium]MCP4276100.1 hypothetical protein [Gammaproteobacteria bacterium]MCP4830844.1 hypothetical protein [Gammaproteobacteria bacterium]MCP4929670.1 hypothetical protein [Gammaproteobacteria bacterium]